eukprot:9280590-Alexandrium_andersonii.AAC.1
MALCRRPPMTSAGELERSSGAAPRKNGTWLAVPLRSSIHVLALWTPKRKPLRSSSACCAAWR